jgi:hypothetical protein
MGLWGGSAKTAFDGYTPSNDGPQSLMYDYNPFTNEGLARQNYPDMYNSMMSNGYNYGTNPNYSSQGSKQQNANTIPAMNNYYGGGQATNNLMGSLNGLSQGSWLPSPNARWQEMQGYSPAAQQFTPNYNLSPYQKWMAEQRRLRQQQQLANTNRTTSPLTGGYSQDDMGNVYQPNVGTPPPAPPAYQQDINYAQVDPKYAGMQTQWYQNLYRQLGGA